MLFPGPVPAPILPAPKDLGEAVVVRGQQHQNPVMTRILSEYYRSPLIPRAVSSNGVGKSTAGFFRFGTDIVCYGECSSGVAPDVQAAADFDAAKAMTVCESEIRLPFDISDVIDNLRRENYVKQLNHGKERLAHNTLVRDAYYFVRELLPVWIRRYMQRAYFKDWQNLPFPHWPVDFTVDSLRSEEHTSEL